MNGDFQSRVLYKQGTVLHLEDGQQNSVSSTVFAIRYLYPGAQQHTTGRIRITCVYRDEESFEAHSGIIERWSDKGWIFIDDYTGDMHAFTSEPEFNKRLLNYAQCFVLGVPLSVVDGTYFASTASAPTKSRKKNPNFDIKKLSKPKQIKQKQKDNYDIESSKKKDDDDDLDWL